MATPAYMETNDADLVRLIKNGAVFIDEANVTVTPPTDGAFTPPATAAKLGYYGEDGFTLSPQTGDETEFTAHNGDVVLAEQAPGYWTVALSGLESNEQTAEAYFDVEVDPLDGSVTVTQASTSKRYTLITAGLDQKDRLIVAHYPNVQINAREDMVFNRTTLLAYGMTFRTFRGGSTYPYHFKGWGFVPEFEDPEL